MIKLSYDVDCLHKGCTLGDEPYCYILHSSCKANPFDILEDECPLRERSIKEQLIFKLIALHSQNVELKKHIYFQRMTDNLIDALKKLKTAISNRSNVLYCKRREERATRELSMYKLLLAGRLYWVDGQVLDNVAKYRLINLPKSTLTKIVNKLHLPTRPRGTLPYTDYDKYDEWCEKVEASYICKKQLISKSKED